METIAKPSVLDIEFIRSQFPILKREVNGKPLVYLDNAATTQKPQEVIEAIDQYYRTYNANIHRGVHTLSQLGTEAYEATREKVKTFLNAASTKEIIFTKGTTDGINLVASGFAKKYLNAGDKILISAMEHHSNIVPWQLICEEKGAELLVIPMNEAGELEQDAYRKLLEQKPVLVAFNHVSNALGTINPAKQMIAEAHANAIPVLIDGAQAVQHLKVDVQDLNADFYVFSGHKLYGPTGVGILYGKEEWLEKLPPYQGGGDMIKTVSFAKTEYNDLPFKFEAGTPNIEAAICLGNALDFVVNTGIGLIASHEAELLKYATEQLMSLKNITAVGTARQKCSVLSFNVDGVHPYDVGVILDKMGIAVRTGHHCAQPIMDFYGIPGTVRASFACYNTFAEVDFFVKGVEKAANMLA